MEDLGNLKYFLGIEVARSRHAIFVFKWKYVLDLLKETGMLDCKVADNLVEQHKNLEERGRVLCCITIGWQVIYLSCSCPDIAHAVSVVNLFMYFPQETHMEAVYRILRYLKSSLGKWLLFA